jgi:citrate synthase
MQVVEDVLVEAGRRLGQLPNVDLGLGALTFVADLPRDASLFAVARIAGWAAHYEEERTERPVRYRGITTRA